MTGWWRSLYRVQVTPRVRVTIDVFDSSDASDVSGINELTAQAKTLTTLGRILRRVCEQQKEPQQ